MAITPKFTAAQVANVLKGQVAVLEGAILNRLKFVGEKFVSNARNNHTYKDQTGNLTSSIGYVILKDGQQVYSAFPGSTAAGKSQAISTAEKSSAKHQKGFVIIVVAGMQYAAAVESKGYDVLTASSNTAETDLKKAITELKSKIGR